MFESMFDSITRSLALPVALTTPPQPIDRIMPPCPVFPPDIGSRSPPNIFCVCCSLFPHNFREPGIIHSMLEITPTLTLDERELHFDFIRSAGPGGQNVNKVATAVQLRFSIPESALPEPVKMRLASLGGKRVTQEGVLIIEARQFRTQEQNKEDAIRRLVALVKQAAHKPRPRRKTRPSLASRMERLKDKKQRGEVKRLRQNTSFE